MSDSVFDFSKAHERIGLRLRFERPLSWSVVSAELNKLGFVWDDEDYGHLPRQDKPAPWQASRICHFNLLEAKSFTMREGIDFEILFSSLPPSSHSFFLEMIGKAQESLGGQIEYHNKVYSKEQMLELFQKYSVDLQNEFAETPGSEFLQRMLLEFRPIDFRWK